MTSELLSVNLGLRICADEELLSCRSVPEWWGRAAQAFFLKIVASQNDMLAGRLHADNELHPYTVSNLFGCSNIDFPMPEQTVYLRLSSFSEELSNCLKQCVSNIGDLIELDYVPFRIQPYDQSMLRITSFADLIRKGAEKSDNPRIGLSSITPLFFKSGGKTEPLPLPKLVYQSLLRKWNAFSPMPFPDDVVRYAEECLGIRSFELKSVSIPVKQGGLRIGTVGNIQYIALNRDKYWLSMIHALTAFAPWCGIGAGTGFGFGQVKF